MYFEDKNKILKPKFNKCTCSYRGKDEIKLSENRRT
jgi:hypothetical protein